jgi:hypothetical protein
MLTISFFPFTDTVDGSILPVFALNLGNLCLGQGTNLNNWGVEYKKLMICGMKKSSNVLLKCPRIPTTANVMPAK